jgi:hypothetical protein
VETVRLLLDAGAMADDFTKSNKPSAADPASSVRTPLPKVISSNGPGMIRLPVPAPAPPATHQGSPAARKSLPQFFGALSALRQDALNHLPRAAQADGPA